MIIFGQYINNFKPLIVIGIQSLSLLLTILFIKVLGYLIHLKIENSGGGQTINFFDNILQYVI